MLSVVVNTGSLFCTIEFFFFCLHCFQHDILCLLWGCTPLFVAEGARLPRDDRQKRSTVSWETGLGFSCPFGCIDFYHAMPFFSSSSFQSLLTPSRSSPSRYAIASCVIFSMISVVENCPLARIPLICPN